MTLFAGGPLYETNELIYLIVVGIISPMNLHAHPNAVGPIRIFTRSPFSRASGKPGALSSAMTDPALHDSARCGRRRETTFSETGLLKSWVRGSALLAIMMCFALNLCTAQEALIVQGFASRSNPNSKFEGRATNGTAMSCTFTAHVSRGAARLDAEILQDTGRTNFVIIFMTKSEVTVYHPTTSGENTFGPAQGKYSANAYLYNASNPYHGNDMAHTLLLPFWREQYPLTNGARFTLFNEVAITHDRQSTYTVTNRGLVPDRGTQMYLCESPGLTRDLWQFDLATNLAGQCYPLSYSRTIIFGKLAPVGKNPIPVTQNLIQHTWQISVSNISLSASQPALPALEGPTHVTDARSGVTGLSVQYLTDKWKTPDEVRNDPAILAQLRPPTPAAPSPAPMVAMSTNSASPPGESPNYFYIALGVGGFFCLFGALVLSRRKNDTVSKT